MENRGVLWNWAGLPVAILFAACLMIPPGCAQAQPNPTQITPPASGPDLSALNISNITPVWEAPLLDFFRSSDKITLFKFEVNCATFPGPRSMAFGPRYIQLTTNPGTLLILAAGACIAVLAFILYRRREAVLKSVTDDSETTEQSPENNKREKQE